jgi:glutathione S-transferase
MAQGDLCEAGRKGHLGNGPHADGRAHQISRKLTSMLELYRWEPNTFSLKPLIVLHEKGLEFADRYVDYLSFEQYDLPMMATSLEVRYNPEGEGPILVDRGAPMTESFFISLYLDEAYPARPLRPADAAGRWRVLMWARFVNEVLTPAVSTLGCHKYLAPALRSRGRRDIEKTIERMPTKEQRDGWLAALNNAYPEELLADSRRKVGVAVKKMEEALAGADWLAGDAYSLADIDAFALLAPVPMLADDLLNARVSPHAAAWLERIRTRPAVQAALASSKTGKPHEAFTPGPEHSRWG